MTAAANDVPSKSVFSRVTAAIEVGANLKTLLLGAGVLVASPLVPRVGAGRAFGLWFWSVTARRPVHYRKSVATQLHTTMKGLDRGTYMLVIGEKGLGKSTAIAVATKGCGGFVVVTVPPGTTHAEIVSGAHRKIARMAQTFLNPETSARRVMWFHHLFFRQNPVVILNATERTLGEPFAQITGAARTLADEGFRVVIDGSPNATDPSAFTTKREEVVHVEPMSAKEMMQDDEFQILVANLKKAGEIHELVWGIVGGVPAEYKQLAQKLRLSPEKSLDVIGTFVQNKLNQAKILRNDFLLAYPEAAPFLERFATQDVVRDERPGTVPAINKVFRRTDNGFYVPSNPAMAFVLKYIPPGADTPNTTTLIGIARGKFPYF